MTTKYKYEAGAQQITTRELRWVIGRYESEPAAQEQALRFARVMEGFENSGDWEPIVREVNNG